MIFNGVSSRQISVKLLNSFHFIGGEKVYGYITNKSINGNNSFIELILVHTKGDFWLESLP